MLVALDKRGKHRLATLTERDQGPFCCPGCAERVFLKKGQIVAHHYAHQAHTNCAYARESKEHLAAKLQIAEALETEGYRYKIEGTIKDQRADILWELDKGKYVAVEIQKSTISLEDMERRTQGWIDKGYAPLWVLFPKEMPVRQHKPSPFEKWIHALHYGRAYHWNSQTSTFVPVHFDRCQYRVVWGDPLTVNDMTLTHRKRFDQGWCHLPEGTIVSDSLGPFWKGDKPGWTFQPPHDYKWSERLVIEPHAYGTTITKQKYEDRDSDYSDYPFNYRRDRQVVLWRPEGRYCPLTPDVVDKYACSRCHRCAQPNLTARAKAIWD